MKNGCPNQGPVFQLQLLLPAFIVCSLQQEACASQWKQHSFHGSQRAVFAINLKRKSHIDFHLREVHGLPVPLAAAVLRQEPQPPPGKGLAALQKHGAGAMLGDSAHKSHRQHVKETHVTPR